MKHFYENQFHYVCGAMLIGLLVLTAGTSWKYSFFTAHWTTTGRPVRSPDHSLGFL